MKVWIAHSHSDAPFVERLAGDLEQAGLHVQNWGNSFPPGALLSDSIVGGISGCDVFIPVITPHSLSSQWFATEIAVALSQRSNGHQHPAKAGRRLRIMPVLAARRATPPLMLRDFQYVDLSDARRYAERLRALIETVETREPVGSASLSLDAVLEGRRRALDLDRASHAAASIRYQRLLSSVLLALMCGTLFTAGFGAAPYLLGGRAPAAPLVAAVSLQSIAVLAVGLYAIRRSRRTTHALQQAELARTTHAGQAPEPDDDGVARQVGGAGQ